MNPKPRDEGIVGASRFLTKVLGLMVLVAGPGGCNVIPGLFPGAPPDGRPVDPPEDPNAPPVAIVGDDRSAQVGETLVFDAGASFDPDGEIVAYGWDFDDDNTAEGAVVEHAFTKAGEFDVTLRVTDDQGETGTAALTVTVEEVPGGTPDRFALTVSLERPGAGEILLEPPGGVYPAGTLVTVTAVPAEGFMFLQFEGDVLSEEPTVDVVVDGDIDITAVIVPSTVSINVDVDPSGSGEAILTPGGGVYGFGTIVTVEAIAFGGFEFESVTDASGSTLSTSAIFDLEATRDFELVAHFREQDITPPPPPPTRTLSISVTPQGAGTVTLDPAGGSYPHGTKVALEATPAAGYTFVRYSGDVASTDPVTIITMDGDKTVTAEFAWVPNFGNPGNLLVTGFSGRNVTEFDRITGGNLGEIVQSEAGGLGLAGGIDVGPGGDLFVVNVGLTDDTSVIRYEGTTGTPIGTFVAGSGALGFLTLRFGPDGNLYVVNTDADSIEQYDGETGAFMSLFVPPASGGLVNPVGLTFGPSGDLFVVSEDTNSVIRYDGATGAPIGTVVDLASFGFVTPVDLAFGRDAALYVSLSGDESVARVDVSTGDAEVFVMPESGGLSDPGGLLFHPDTNNLLVVSQGSNAVLEYDGNTGEFLRVFAVGDDGDSLFFMALRPL